MRLARPPAPSSSSLFFRAELHINLPSSFKEAVEIDLWKCSFVEILALHVQRFCQVETDPCLVRWLPGSALGSRLEPGALSSTSMLRGPPGSGSPSPIPLPAGRRYRCPRPPQRRACTSGALRMPHGWPSSHPPRSCLSICTIACSHEQPPGSDVDIQATAPLHSPCGRLSARAACPSAACAPAHRAAAPARWHLGGG